jgi:hypothetical protein
MREKWFADVNEWTGICAMQVPKREQEQISPLTCVPFPERCPSFEIAFHIAVALLPFSRDS